MRQTAEKLEKGKWYADIDEMSSISTFLKFDRIDNGYEIFSEIKGFSCYIKDKTGIRFSVNSFKSFIPTKEDREKYNLIDDE